VVSRPDASLLKARIAIQMSPSGRQSALVQKLEAEVVQIQLFISFSLRYLILVDQQDLVLGGFLFLSFGPLLDSSLVSYCFRF
jgi:hypothetical protein